MRRGDIYESYHFGASENSEKIYGGIWESYEIVACTDNDKKKWGSILVM